MGIRFPATIEQGTHRLAECIVEPQVIYVGLHNNRRAARSLDRLVTKACGWPVTLLWRDERGEREARQSALEGGRLIASEMLIDMMSSHSALERPCHEPQLSCRRP